MYILRGMSSQFLFHQGLNKVLNSDSALPKSDSLTHYVMHSYVMPFRLSHHVKE